jgi:Ulp1 protease family, C-terminal catalytic domain
VVHGRKRGYENVKKWTSKVDIFSKEYIVIPVNEASSPPSPLPYFKVLVLMFASAHWYVAIICNLDKAKAKKDVPTPKPPRTRSQIEPLTPEEIDVEEDTVELATPRIVAEEMDEDNEIVLNSQPTNSRGVTPEKDRDSIVTEDGIVEVVSVEVDPISGPETVKPVDLEPVAQTEGIPVQPDPVPALETNSDSMAQADAVPALQPVSAPVAPLTNSETNPVTPQSDAVPDPETIPMELDIPNIQPDPLSVPQPSPNSPSRPIPDVPSEPVPMDLDPPEKIENDLREMPISGKEPDPKYDFQNDDSITEIDRLAIEKVISGQREIRYSRRKSAARKQDPITLEDEEEEPISITAALKKKYRPTTQKSPARRTSNKIIPPDS